MLLAKADEAGALNVYREQMVGLRRPPLDRCFLGVAVLATAIRLGHIEDRAVEL
jgi:hypothetical protein